MKQDLVSRALIFCNDYYSVLLRENMPRMNFTGNTFTSHNSTRHFLLLNIFLFYIVSRYLMPLWTSRKKRQRNSLKSSTLSWRQVTSTKREYNSLRYSVLLYTLHTISIIIRTPLKFEYLQNLIRIPYTVLAAQDNHWNEDIIILLYLL